jgi:hypothetical protein
MTKRKWKRKYSLMVGKNIIFRANIQLHFKRIQYEEPSLIILMQQKRNIGLLVAEHAKKKKNNNNNNIQQYFLNQCLLSLYKVHRNSQITAIATKVL